MKPCEVGHHQVQLIATTPDVDAAFFRCRICGNKVKITRAEMVASPTRNPDPVVIQERLSGEER